MVVSRSCITALPQESHSLNGRPLKSIVVAAQAQEARSWVISFQCRSTAIGWRAAHQFPATESPTRATVSTGCLVSPNTHSLGWAPCSTRQPSFQYDGLDSASSGGSTGSAGTRMTLPASTAAPGYFGPSLPFQGPGWPVMYTHTRATGRTAASAVDTDSEGFLAS